MSSKRIILYADDDPDDFELVQDSFSRYDGIELVHCTNGKLVLQLLEEMTTEKCMPCMIILDMNMPVMDGRQTLIHLKKNAALTNVPVIIFTTSNSRLDQFFAQTYGARFMTKPKRLDEAQNLAEELATQCNIQLLS